MQVVKDFTEAEKAKAYAKANPGAVAKKAAAKKGKVGRVPVFRLCAYESWDSFLASTEKEEVKLPECPLLLTAQGTS